MLFGDGYSTCMHSFAMLYSLATVRLQESQFSKSNRKATVKRVLPFEPLTAGALKYSKEDGKGSYFWAPLGRGGSGSSWLELRRRTGAIGFSVVWENKW